MRWSLESVGGPFSQYTQNIHQRAQHTSTRHVIIRRAARDIRGGCAPRLTLPSSPPLSAPHHHIIINLNSGPQYPPSRVQHTTTHTHKQDTPHARVYPRLVTGTLRAMRLFRDVRIIRDIRVIRVVRVISWGESEMQCSQCSGPTLSEPPHSSAA